ncbi:MAG: DNA double-strand break repair nuclease NurA [Sulfolobales archaeon]
MSAPASLTPNAFLAIKMVVEALSSVERDIVYLGLSESGFYEEREFNVYLYDPLGSGLGSFDATDYLLGFSDERPYTGYLDSSSRSISFLGARVFVGSGYAFDSGRHLLIPQGLGFPFIAVKAGGRAIEALRKIIGGIAFLESPSGEIYGSDYKDDNILDELRLRIENRLLSLMTRKLILIDGPIFPVPLAYIETFGERYRAAFEKLYEERSSLIGRLVGIVKRLEQTYKLYRVEEVRRFFENTVGGKNIGRIPDPVILSRLAGNKKIYSMGVFKEEFTDLGNRYMIYVYVRSPSGARVFRVESMDRVALMEVAGYLLKSLSHTGLPIDIEVADRISRRLSASAYMALYALGSRSLGVSHDERSRLPLILGEVNEA